MPRKILQTLSGSTSCQRIQVCMDAAGPSGLQTITLIEQNHAQGIGWFDQRSMTLDLSQWKQLRSMFGSLEADGPSPLPEPPRLTLRFPGVFRPEDDTVDDLVQHAG